MSKTHFRNNSLEEFTTEVDKEWPKGTTYAPDWKPNPGDGMIGRGTEDTPVDVWTVSGDDGTPRIVAAYIEKSRKGLLAPQGCLDAFLSPDSDSDWRYRMPKTQEQSE